MNIAKQCACGQWWSDTGKGHTTCKDCRLKAQIRAAKRARRKPQTRQAMPGSQQWAEQRGGLIGGYEED